MTQAGPAGKCSEARGQCGQAVWVRLVEAQLSRLWRQRGLRTRNLEEHFPKVP